MHFENVCQIGFAYFACSMANIKEDTFQQLDVGVK